MRRLCQVLGLLVVVAVTNVTTVYLVTGHSRVSLAGPTDTACGCDVTGDGVVDVSDPIALLGYIFNGDAIACAQTAGLTEAEIVLLKDVLQHVTVEQLDDGQGGTNKTVRFTGVNLQIVNGLGATNGAPGDPDGHDGITNGLGNLIVGYDEPFTGGAKTGSHNFVGGLRNNYTSFGGAVLGRANSSAGPLATLLGGQTNAASGAFSVVVGGRQHVASGDRSVIVGGKMNQASGELSVVVAGRENQATLGQACVVSGRYNVASSSGACVVGGNSNTASGEHAVVCGGQSNLADGAKAVVLGGDSNTSSGEKSVVGGGQGRSVSGFADWQAGSLFEDQ